MFQTVRGFKEEGFGDNKVEIEDTEDYDDFRPPKYSSADEVMKVK